MEPSIHGISSGQEQPGPRPATKSAQLSFKDLLRDAVARQEEVKFSLHAKSRLQERHIHLTSQEKLLLNEAVEKAAQKGAQESLVLLNDLALVVSVRNRTVITAMNSDQCKDKIFTNIDSAVILGLDLLTERKPSVAD
ncbi:MAG: hypothetical protein ONB05_11105 [candidate division KSB1 bacterium]|nr:hypothetical protein [candidate division KSB1 bacterium]